MKLLVARICLGLGLAATPSMASAAEITIGVPDWPSAHVTAEVLGQTIAESFGATVSYEQKSSMRVLTGLADGSFDIHPEVWLPNLQQHLDRLVQRGSDVHLAPHRVEARQGMCISNETAAGTGMTNLAQLADPDIARQFDSDGDGLGEVWIGAPMWTSTLFEQVRARSLGYDKTMQLLEYDEGIAMAGVDAAIAFGKPVVFFCYAPHHIFQLHDVVFLGEAPHDPSSWNVLTRAEDPDWLENSTASTAWPSSLYTIAYAGHLRSEHAEIASFLDAVVFAPEDATTMSYAIEVEGLSPSEAAVKWRQANQSRISEWLQ